MKDLSQTEWITVYRIYPTEGSRLNYTLNIIDTPGFGDIRGIQRDNDIVDQIRYLFSAPGEQGVMFIDAVCFIVKAPDARLTVVQKNIFNSIMSLFGKDLEANICTLITFADGAKPPVLASLEESKLPFGKTFTFNNSALFAENVDSAGTLTPMFWEMGCKSFEKLFESIKVLETKSLRQTKNVLDEREQLRTIIANVRPQVTAGLTKLSELKEQLNVFQKIKNEIEDNKSFEYTVDETRQEIISLPKGQHVTNCLNCNVTCHEICTIKDDDNKMKCSAMDANGNCTVCIGKCCWREHKNTPYIFKYITQPVTKTYAEMKKKYEKAIGETFTKEKYIEKLTYDVNAVVEGISCMVSTMNRCKTRLKEIALRPDPLSTVEHIDLMILSEEREKQPGYFNRIKMLQEMKKMSLIDVEFDTLSKHLQDAKQSTISLMGRSFETDKKGKKKEAGNFLNRGIQYVQKML